MRAYLAGRSCSGSDPDSVMWMFSDLELVKSSKLYRTLLDKLRSPEGPGLDELPAIPFSIPLQPVAQPGASESMEASNRSYFRRAILDRWLALHLRHGPGRPSLS